MAISRILAATDFSAPAQRAIERAGEIARRTGAELRLIHVVPDAGIFGQLSRQRALTHAQMLRGAERALGDVCTAVENSHGVKAAQAIVTGAARRALIDAAIAFGADLLVVGARGESDSTLREPSLGGTALKLLASSPAPLLLVRRAVEDGYRKVVIAVAVSTAAPRVLAAAMPFAEQAECHLLHAFEAPFAARLRSFDVSPAAIDAYAREHREAQERALSELIALSGIPDRLRSHVVRGSAATTILGEIEALQPDLVVVGKHEKGMRNPAESRSVALRVAFGAPCDVLQVP